VNEEAMARLGPQRHRKKKIIKQTQITTECRTNQVITAVRNSSGAFVLLL